MPVGINSLRRYRQNLQDDIDGAALYAALSRHERDPARKDLFLQLAQAGNERADIWRNRFLAEGITYFPLEPTRKVRLLIFLAQCFGAQFVLSVIKANKYADSTRCLGQYEAENMPASEHSQAAEPGAAAKNELPWASGNSVDAEYGHRDDSGNKLRAVVMDINSGLISNFCLMMGVVGMGIPPATGLMIGVLGLLAGSLSITVRVWLLANNARDIVRNMPIQKGLSAGPDSRPWRAAGIALLSFSLGAILPVLPFFLWTDSTGVFICIYLSLLGLGAIGMATATSSGHGFVFSILRQILFGGAAAVVAFGVGYLLGISVIR